MLARHQLDRLHSVVMLGIPNQTSAAAATLKQWSGGKLILGDNLKGGLCGPIFRNRMKAQLQ